MQGQKFSSSVYGDCNYVCWCFQRLLRNFRLNEQCAFTYRTLLEISNQTSNSKTQHEKDEFTNFLRNLVQTQQVIGIPGGARSPIGQQLATIFDENQLPRSQSNSSLNNFSTESQVQSKKLQKRSLPTASVKEFILRTVASRPCSFSRPSVQRLYACFKNNEIKITGAFSEDILYG